MSDALWEPVTPSADYVTVTPSGSISSTDLQSALEELDTEKLAITDVSSTPTSGATTTPISSDAAFTLLMKLNTILTGS